VSNPLYFYVRHLMLPQAIGIIFRKSLRLSGRARVDHSVGQITTMISSDATRLDMSAAFFHKYVSRGFILVVAEVAPAVGLD
jgi:hypothetical protein